MLYKFYWRRPLRPLRHAVDSLASDHYLLQAVSFATRPLCGFRDSMSARAQFRRAPVVFTEDDLDVRTFCDHLPTFSDRVSLRPEYDLPSFTWVLEV